MLVFVSDLHLVDSERRSSLDVSPFIAELEACMGRCAPHEPCTLVLLGDIFELLKSDRWVGTELRPWSPPSADLSMLVGQILQGIYQRNRPFFDEINRLCVDMGLKLNYVPGNHDGLMFSACMGPVRAALRAYLPALAASDPAALFVPSVSDPGHGTYAEHGHEFDKFNRLQRGGGRVIPGDVVVVEILAHLAIEAANELGLADPLVDQHGPDLQFLQDLDDIVPQDATSLLAWIEFGLANLSPERRDLVEAAICRAFGRCLGRAAKVFREDSGAAFRYRQFAKVVGSSIATGRLRVAKAVGYFAPSSANEISEVSKAAMKLTAAAVYGGSRSIEVIVAGHTHLPIHHPVTLPGGKVTYLNSGTWRRVLLFQPNTAGSHAFAEYVETTIVCIPQRDRDGSVRYDYRRRTYRS